MAFRGEVQDGARAVFRQQLRHALLVADIGAHEDMARIAFQPAQVLQVARVSQLIQVDDRLIGLGQPIEDEIAANEPGSASYQNCHNIVGFC